MIPFSFLSLITHVPGYNLTTLQIRSNHKLLYSIPPQKIIHPLLLTLPQLAESPPHSIELHSDLL